MAEPSEYITLFEELSSRVVGLQQKSRLSVEFVAWHRDLLAAVEQCFGSNSPELATVRMLQFEVSPEAVEWLIGTFADPEKLDEQQRRLGTPLDPKVKEGMVNLSQHPMTWLNGMQQHHYLKMLGRVSELLKEFQAVIRLRDAHS
jgi:hypothetical protein